MLAGILRWPQATFASKVIVDAQNKHADVTREVDSGLEMVRVGLPAVITTDLRLNEPRQAYVLFHTVTNKHVEFASMSGGLRILLDLLRD